MFLCYFPSRNLVNETLDHNETAVVLCSETQGAFSTVVLLLSDFKDSLWELWNQPISVNQNPGLSSHAESEEEACLPSVLSKALHPLKAHVQGIHQVPACSSPSLALLSWAQCGYWLPPHLTSTILLGFSASFSHSRSCVEGEIQPHERGSPTPTNFQNLSISCLHQPLFSQLWRFPHVFTQPLHSGHSNPSPWRGLNYHSIAPPAWCPYLKAEVETEIQFHAQCSTGKRPT